MIKRFEDLPVWKDARKLTKQIYEVTNNGKFERDYRLKGQIQGSSVSIMSNIAEGFENQSTKQFIRYLFIARGSSGEMKHLKEQATSISKQCTGLINYLENYSSTTNVVKEPDKDEFFQIITDTITD